MAIETHTKETSVKSSDGGSFKQTTVEEKETVEVPRKETTIVQTGNKKDDVKVVKVDDDSVEVTST